MKSTAVFWFVLLGATALATGCGDKSATDANANNNTNANDNTNSNTNNNTNSNGGACVPLAPPQAEGVHVSVDGSPTGTGSSADPVDLETALSSGGPAEPGDTIWLAAGTYLGVFTSDLSGTDTSPITVRPLPGAHVILDSNAGVARGTGLTINGEWATYRGLEVLSSDPDRASEEDTSSPTDITLGGGISIFGPNVKVINCVVHDTAQGFSFWNPAVDSEVYGNIIFNNGWTAPGRGHGHAIYTQNETGTKRIEDNIIFFGFGTGIHAYTEGGSIQGFQISDNVWFHTGASDPRASQRKDNCLVGGLQPVARFTMTRNLGWSLGRGTRLGYGDSVQNIDATLTDNYLVESLWIWGLWETLTFAGNTFYGSLDNVDPADFPGNEFAPDPPDSGTRVFVNPNRYDAGRARVAIYNYDESATVDVDLTALLQSGEAYTVHSVFDLRGPPLVEGTYDGAPVAFPMGAVAPPQPNGLPDGIAQDDDPMRIFGAFILTHTGCQ
jgi:hypothetical protein